MSRSAIKEHTVDSDTPTDSLTSEHQDRLVIDLELGNELKAKYPALAPGLP
jgi:hypothetical protein